MKITQEQAQLFYSIHGRIQDDAMSITSQEFEGAVNVAFLMIEQATARISSLNKAVCEEIENRDQWESRATKLAFVVGEYFETDVGEHSNANCPINNAHKLLNQVL